MSAPGEGAPCPRFRAHDGQVEADEEAICQDCVTAARAAREIGVPAFFLTNYVRPRSQERGTGPTLYATVVGPTHTRNWRICRTDLDAFKRDHSMTVQGDYQALVDRRQREFEWLAGPGREGTAPDESTAGLLPEEICVLDIETLGKNPDRHAIACIGTKKFLQSTGRGGTLDGPEFAPAGYRCFVPDGVPELHAADPQVETGPEAWADLACMLKDVRGPIVGHNILAFDYAFLHGHIDLSELVPKTVDTLYLLWQCSGQELRGLSLDALSGPGYGKSFKPASVPQLWRDGDYSAVIAYNENDCDLTMDLWWRLTTRKFYPVFGATWGKELVLLKARDMEVISGRRPQITFDEWMSRVGSDIACAVCGRTVKQWLMYSRTPQQEPMCATCARQRRADEKQLMEERIAEVGEAIRTSRTARAMLDSAFRSHSEKR